MNAPKRLSLGPGAPQQLEALLRSQAHDRVVTTLGDLADLLSEAQGHALIDGALLPKEDLGILTRALKAGGLSISVLGGDPGAGALRELLKHPRTAWVPYPPDTEELSQLLIGRSSTADPSAPEDLRRSPRQERPKAERPSQAAPSPTPSQLPSDHAETTPKLTEETATPPPVDPNLAEIEAILGQPAAAFQAQAAPPERDKPTTPARAKATEPTPTQEPAQAEAAAPKEQAEEVPSPAPAAPPALAGIPEEPAWFKDQIADLADIVQAIHASTAGALGETSDAPPGLLADSMRLVQFTRTLGFLAAPPARGDAQFDLGDLSEELLRGAGAAADAPRFLLKVSDPLPVRGDKELIVQAMDAFLVLARLCAGPEGEVRLFGKKGPDGGALLQLGFPRGPLGDMSPAEIVTPYALRASLPDMGKNALRAAARILEGQGGSATLRDQGEGKLQLEIILPAP